MSEPKGDPESVRGSGRRFSIRRLSLLGSGVLLAVFVAIQFVPVDRTNPPVNADVSAPPEVKAVLHRACYDCHSNETVWPWYSYVAPASWKVAWDVQEAREHLNLSTWDRYDTQMQTAKRQEMWEEVSQGEMPPWFYTPMHPDAKLSADDKMLLREWANGSKGTPPTDENE